MIIIRQRLKTASGINIFVQYMFCKKNLSKSKNKPETRFSPRLTIRSSVSEQYLILRILHSILLPNLSIYLPKKNCEKQKT